MSYNQSAVMNPNSQFFLAQMNPTFQNNSNLVESMFNRPMGPYEGYPEPTNYYNFGVSLPTGKMGPYQECLAQTPPPCYPYQEIVWSRDVNGIMYPTINQLTPY